MQSRQINAGPLQLAALDNQGKGELIVGLHGFLDNAMSLSPLFPYFSDFHFIALDWAGHGRSDHRANGAHYHQADYLQDLYAALTELTDKPCILLGHSLGGILATQFAALFPEKVKAVVSIDACGPLTKTEDTTTLQMRDSILSRHGKSAGTGKPVDLEKAVAARCRVSDIAEAHARTILQRNLKRGQDGLLYWCSDPRLRTQSTLRLTETQAKDLMTSIQCPVWFGAASNSFKKVATVYPQRQSWFSNSQIDHFSGGHHIHMEQPEAVSAAIRQFVVQL